MFPDNRFGMGILSAANGTHWSKLYSIQYTSWIFQMATHANGIDVQSKNITEFNGTRACWTHVEH